MGKLSNIIPVSDLRQDAAKLLKQLRNSKEPLIITQRGRATAVIIGVDAYEKSEHEKELLRLLAKGEREIETGQGYDLDTVLAEADAILSKEPSWRSNLHLLPKLNSFLRYHTFEGINLQRPLIFVIGLKKSCEGLRIFQNPEELYLNFQNSPTEKWSYRRTDFFIKSKPILFGLLRCGMARSFQKDHHLNANLKIHRTQKAGPVIKPLYLLAKKHLAFCSHNAYNILH
jgi:prevent-host-death family protein